MTREHPAPDGGRASPAVEGVAGVTAGDPAAAPGGQDRGAVAPVAVGVVLLVLGLVMVREAYTIDVGRDLVRGPRLFPAVITITFTALAAVYLVQQVMHLLSRRARDGEGFGDLPRVVGMVALLLVYGSVLEAVGYVLSTFVLFVIGSWLLGSRAWRRDLVVGIGLSLGIYLLFTQLLAVRLPQGVIPLG